MKFKIISALILAVVLAGLYFAHESGNSSDSSNAPATTPDNGAIILH